MKVSDLDRPSDYDPFPNSHLSLGKEQRLGAEDAGTQDEKDESGTESLHLGKCAEITDPIPIKFST